MSTVDTNILQWVKSEIDETLKQAQASLEAYVEDTADESQMRFCINYLHQVHGTLQMVELHGAALAIEEMEKLSKAIFDNKVNNKDDAYETLMRGILQVPDYLEHLLAGNPDMPVVLLPLLNDIRAARNEALLSEGALFTPDLNVAAPAAEFSVDSAEDGGLSALARKLRHNYHLGLLSWFQNKNPKAGLEKIADVISQLTQASESDEARRVFWIASGLVESLKDDGVDTSVAVKMLMGHVDRQIKKIIDNGAFALDEVPPEELEKNLLYYVASSTTSGEHTKEIKEAFNLKDIMPDTRAVEQARADLTAPNAALMETVSTVIVEDINNIKDKLDVYVRADEKDLSMLESVHGSLTQMADTLAMLNLGVQREAVLKQAEVINGIVSGNLTEEETELMNVAAAMIAVENSLSEMSSAKAAASIEVAEGVDAGDAALAKMQGAEQQKLMQTVLDEAKVNLARVKDALTEFSNNNEEREQLISVPALLEQIQGSLMILSLEDAANLLTLTTNYIRNKLINETIPPSFSDMNNLADAISSLEYYMESLMGNWGQPEAILTVAEQSLQALGINTDVVAEAEGDTQLGVIEEESVEVADVSDNLPEVSNENISLDDLSLELTDAASSVDDDISLDDITLDEGLEFESEEISADEILTNDEDSITAPPAIDIESIQVSSVTPEPVKEPSLLDDTIDDEIIEIFMEEAEEAYETISGLLPGWIDNTANDEPLKEIRRAYHTLKGSGRLVGAIDLGEFAWAFENMLNRVLDSTIKVNPEILELMERGKQTLPDLFELFKINKKPGKSILTLMEYADALSQGKSINIDTVVSDEIQTESVPEIKEESEPEIITLTEIDEEPLVEIVEAELPPVDIDTALLEIYRKEVSIHCDSIKQYIADWNNGEREASHVLLRALHTLTGSSRTTGVQSVAVVCSHFESYVKHLQDVEAALPQVALTELENTIELIESTVDCLDQAGAVLPEHEALLSRIDNLPKDTEPEDIAPVVEMNAVEAIEVNDTEVAEPVVNNVPLPDYDEELLEIFLEEGTEILEESDQIIHEWISNPDEDEFVKALQRHLHTLKGGARMAGIAELGDLGHSIESLLTAVVDGHMQASKPMFELVQRAQDRLVKMLELVQAHSGLTAATDLLNEVDAMLENRGIVSDEEFVFESAVDINNESSLNSSTVELSELEKLEEELRLDSNIEVEDSITLPDLELPDVKEDVANSEIESADVISLDLTNEDQIQKVAEEKTVPDVDKEDEHDRRHLGRVKSEQVRVRSDLLDNLVNFAGEVSIYRSRLEQQTNNFRYNITEFDDTVNRLREQLRQFEIETETQIEYKSEDLSSAQENFDPLEMDRFTTMQHLSRAMMESLGDLDSLRGILNNLTRESETLLLQQSRDAHTYGTFFWSGCTLASYCASNMW